MPNHTTRITFTKMEGLANDYIYIDCMEAENATVLQAQGLLLQTGSSDGSSSSNCSSSSPGPLQREDEEDADVVQRRQAFIRRVSDRHRGIGGDGVVFILKESPTNNSRGHTDTDTATVAATTEEDEQQEFRMRMFNTDGSEAEMCGNAIRCVGKYLYDRGYISQRKVHVDTDSGEQSVHVNVWSGVGLMRLEVLLGPASDSSLTSTPFAVNKVRVDMGVPILDAEQVPTTLRPTSSLKLGGVVAASAIISEPLPRSGTLPSHYKVTCVSMGNPHCVVFLDDDHHDQLQQGDKTSSSAVDGGNDVSSIPDECVWQHGKAIEGMTSIFPNRVNVEFCKIRQRSGDNLAHIDMRVWERGSGETMACGTGAAAVGVSAILNDLVDGKRHVVVHLRGGNLLISWCEQTGRVFMTGAATHVFDGSIQV